MKTRTCKQGITFSVPINPFISMLSGPNHLANILHPYSLAYSNPCETSKMKSFVRIAMRKNSLAVASEEVKRKIVQIVKEA